MLLVNEIIKFSKHDGNKEHLKFIAFPEGKQAKAYYSGCYQTQYEFKKVYVKASQYYPADDVAEVFAADFFQALKAIDISAQFAKCEFLIAPDENRYVSSEGFFNWINLKQIALGKLNETAGLDVNQFSSNSLLALQKILPLTKILLTKFIEQDIVDLPEKAELKARLRTELSEVLILSYLIGDYDVQPENIGIFQDLNNKLHIGKIDHGWALASICILEDYAQPSITDPILVPFGSLGTHRYSLTPTNHFNNYSKIISCPEFINVITRIINTDNLEYIITAIENTLKKILNYEDCKLLAQHIGITADEIERLKTKEELTAVMNNKLSKIIWSRAKKLVDDYHPDKKCLQLIKISDFECLSDYQETRPNTKITKYGFELI